MYVTKQKMAARRKRIFLRRLMIALVALAVIFIMLVAFGVINLKSNPLGQLKKLPIAAGEQWAFAGNAFTYLSDSVLSYYDVDTMNLLWTIDVQAKDQHLAMSDDIQLVYNASALQLVTGQFPVEFSGRVVDVKCAKDYIAVLKKESGGNFSMQVLDAQSNTVDQLTFGKQYILDFGFYDDTDTLWTLSVDISQGSAPQSTITTYTVGKSQTGLMSISEQMVEKVEFSSKSIFAFGTNYLLRYNHVGNKEQYRKLIYGWKVIDFSPAQKPLAILTPRSEAGKNLSVIKVLSISEDDATADEALIQTPTGTLSASVLGGNIVCVTQGAAYVFSPKGEQLETYPFAQPVEAAEKLDDTRLLIRRGSELFLASFG